MDKKTTSIPGLPRPAHVAVALVSGIAVFALGVWVVACWIDGGWETKAPIGDALNILTAFFTALAFAGVVISLWYQQRELRGTLEELQKSDDAAREALEKQGEAIAAMRMQADAIKEQNVALSRPYIVVRQEVIRGAIIRIVVENTGKTAALNLKLSTDQTKPYPGSPRIGKEEYGFLPDVFAFNNEIGTFPPGQRLLYWIATGSEIRDKDPEYEDHPSSFTVTATYSFEGMSTPVEEVTVIDMRVGEQSFIEETPTEKELKKIREELQALNRNAEKVIDKI